MPDYDYEARARAVKAAKLGRFIVRVVSDAAAVNDVPVAEILGAMRDAPDNVRARTADAAHVHPPSALTWAMACDLAGEELGVPPDIE